VSGHLGGDLFLVHALGMKQPGR